VPDAHELPAIPGSAYLKVDPDTFERFRAAMVSDPYRRRDEGEDRSGPAPVTRFQARSRSGGERTARTFAERHDGERRSASVMEVAVERLAPAAPRVHQVWLPPLAPAIPLDRLLPIVDPGGAGGLFAPGWSPAARLSVPLGVLDRPEDQLQVPLVADFAGATGHLAVVGSPQSGKSTLLRTLLAAFILSHRPEEAQFYCVDLGGGALQAVAGAPHVGSVTGRHDPERVRRVIGTVQALLDDREQLFLAKGIDSVQTFRALRDRGQLQGDDLGDVFLVLDNWAAIRQEFEDLEPVVVDLAARGLGYGIHLVVAANRWLDIRPNLRDSIGSRLELRLADPLDSEIGRKEAANVPVGVPGRGLTLDRLHFQTALPRIDGQASAAGLQEALEDLVGRAKAAWHGPSVRPVHVLPSSLRHDELPAPGEDAEPGVPIGVAETDLAPVYLDLCGPDPHLMVFGDGESGKTTFLRWFIRGLTARQPPAKAKLVVVDYRRTLLDAVDDDHLAGYAGAAPAATEMLAELQQVLRQRLPGADLTVRQLRERSWWTGPEVYVVVDDYDLVVTPSGNPLLALLDFLAQGRDVGVHLILARRVGGAARALYEPVLQRVKELGSPGIILSGDLEEGPLLGPHRAMPRVPGRGLLVRRQRRSVLLQAPWLPPDP
jgi:ESX secretion system protein EccC